MTKDNVNISKIIDRPVADVWKYLTKTHHLRNWWGAGLSLDLVVGGDFVERWIDQDGQLCLSFGEVIAFKKNSYLKISWQDEGWDFVTSLEIWLIAVKAKTKVKIKHSGFANFAEDERENLLRAYSQGWRYHLNRLQKYTQSLVKS